MKNKCNKCGKIQDISNFYIYKRLGYVSYSACKNCRRIYNKKYKTEINPSAYKKSKLNHKLNHKDYYKTYMRNYMRNRMKNPIFKLASRTRTRIISMFRKNGIKKDKKLEEILGIDSKGFCEYLLKTKPINLEVKDCHIDHIIPLKRALELNTYEEKYNKLIELNYYKNLRLISAHDNLIKGAK